MYFTVVWKDKDEHITYKIDTPADITDCDDHFELCDCVLGKDTKGRAIIMKSCIRYCFIGDKFPYTFPRIKSI